MNRILGILGLLVAVYFATWYFQQGEGFMSAFNQTNLIRRIVPFAIISIGVSFVIITGGIDLSIGSVICLLGLSIPYLAVERGLPLPLVLVIIATTAVAIGLAHGLLITKLDLPPFVVTLCGLLIYRGLMRSIDDQGGGFEGQYEGFRQIVTGELPVAGGFGIPWSFFILLVVGIAAAIFLNKTIWGRYLLALGNNAEAARLSGVNVDRLTIVAYVICALLAALGGILMICDDGSGKPVNYGNFLELWAIAGAVLGGCSLRGGSGTILGAVIGAALMIMLRNMINLVFPGRSYLEFLVIGIVLLVGVILDEVVRKAVARRRKVVA